MSLAPTPKACTPSVLLRFPDKSDSCVIGRQTSTYRSHGWPSCSQHLSHRHSYLHKKDYEEVWFESNRCYSFIHSFIQSFIHSFIHSFNHSFIQSLRSVSYDRSVASSKASSQQNAINFQSPRFSLSSSSSCLSLLPRLLVTSILLCIFP